MVIPGIATWLFGPQLIGFVFLIIGSIQHFFPPKKINNWYGYRTPAAQRNQQTWDEANRYSANYMIKCGLIFIVLGLLFSGVMNTVHVALKVRAIITIFLLLVSGMLPAILMIISTEKHLTKTFGDK